MKREILTRSITSNVQVREAGEGKKTIEGFIPYNSRSEDLGGFYEYISESAFAKTLNDGADVRALVNHDSSQLIGRVSNGSLRLRSESDGLHIECDLVDGISFHDDLYRSIQANLNTGLSFGFSIIKQDYGTEEVNGRSVETHTLKEVRLYEVSYGVTFPAYPETNASARNIRGIDLSALNSALNHETLTTDDEALVRNYIEQLRTIIEPVETEETTEAAESTPVEPVESEQYRACDDKLDEILKGVRP